MHNWHVACVLPNHARLTGAGFPGSIGVSILLPGRDASLSQLSCKIQEEKVREKVVVKENEISSVTGKSLTCDK